MILSNVLVGIDQAEQQRLITVSFTALVLNELVMIALEINTWHKYMIYSEIATFGFYFLSIPLLGDYFGNSWPQRQCNSWKIYHTLSHWRSFGRLP
jgi:phospholipid-translocating ATPase